MRISGVVVWLSLAGAALAAAPSAADAAEPCRRYAATPERVASGDDNRPDTIHAAGGAVSCPNDVWVQVTACVQLETVAGWVDVGCMTSPRTHITPITRGGRGQGVSFDVPCVSGVVRTHMTGGEGLEPTEWDSASVAIACGVHDVPVDTTPPLTSIGSGPSGLTRDASPSFGFASSEANSTFECRLDAPGWSVCTSPVAYAGLADGAYTFRVRATDPAGNLGLEATRTFTVDTSAPATSIESGPSGTVAVASASFGFSSEPGASFECRLDAAAWTPCTSPVAYDALADGEYSFGVRATDPAGNLGAEATRTFTVDTSAPATSIVSGPSGTVAVATASFVFTSEPGASFECRLDAAAWTPCTSPAAYAGLAIGTHSFRVRATDAAGNTGAEAARTWRRRRRPADPPQVVSAPVDTAVSAELTIAPAAVVLPVVAALDTTAPRIAIPARRLALTASRAGVVRVSLGALEEDASGSLELRAGVLRLGRASFTARAGRTAVAEVKLSRSGYAALRHRSRLAVNASVTVRDAAGNTSTTVLAFVLTAARASSSAYLS